MASSTFVLKEPNCKDKTLIYLFFHYQNQRFKYSTGLKINPKFWNTESQRVRETKDFTSAAEYNTSLKDLTSAIDSIYRRLVNDKVTPSNERLRIELNNLSVEAKTESKNDLIQFAEQLIKASTKKPNTIKHYNQALRVLKEYKSQSKKALLFETIDLDFYEDFMRFCLDKKLSNNTIGGYVKNIKVFMNEAFDRKLTSNIEFKNRRFKTLEEDSDSIYLSNSEIDLLYKLDLKNNERLDKVRDMFIIGCSTGLRYSDLLTISEKNLIEANTKLKLRTEKTGETVVIPVNKYFRAILKKYKGFPEYSISNQKMNQYLKELGELAEINGKVLISTTSGGKKIIESIEKYKLITVHTARRSFATNAYLMNVPSISIMKITGHRTEKAFLKYIKISQEDNANKLINHPFFK